MRHLLLIYLMFLSAVLSAQTLKNGKLCSDDQALCIQGVLRVDSSQGTATLTGRVSKTTRPGFIRITLHGYAEKQVFVAYIQGRIKGQYSEVVYLKNGASHHSDIQWKIKRFEYLAVE